MINGNQMYQWMVDLFPICRSLTGAGVRETLTYIQGEIPELEFHSVPSGTKAFDWTVPDEWIIHEAHITDEFGNKIIDFSINNLHVVGYSEPVDQWMDLEELEGYLYSLPDQPDAIPYVTSYYKRRWGFCLTDNQRKTLKKCSYHVVIKSIIEPGELNYGELLIKGRTDEEVFLSTYLCHPSMANDNLSGIVVSMALAKWIASVPNRKYTYRIVFIPETIGSLVYLSSHLEYLKKKVIAGYIVTCVGDDRCYSFLPSRNENTVSDKVALHVLKHIDENFKAYPWLVRGSDERQYCAPGVDLPIASIMRSKYDEYPEYHTSLDNLDFIKPHGLEGGYTAIRRALEVIENDAYLKVTVLGEPQFGKRNLFPKISIKGATQSIRMMINIVTYCDGHHTLLDIANIINKPFWEILPVAEKLIEEGILSSG